MQDLVDGLVAVVKKDCPTCQLVVPALKQLDDLHTVIVQDNPDFVEGIRAIVELDESLERSYQLNIETVPTLVRIKGGNETDRIVGWNRDQWESFTGQTGLGPGLVDAQPGCGARNVEPGRLDELEAQFGAQRGSARRVELGDDEDDTEACYARGWSDGLPVVAPTAVRVLRMLRGTSLDPDDVIAHYPTNHVPVTVEKVAANAVMAGCLPEYLPVVLAAVEAACLPEYALRAHTASTWSSAPMVVVSGPVTSTLGMEDGFSALGSGNRANATIGRALNLVIRNVGGVRGGEISRATFGNPGRYTFCFAENERNTTWTPLATDFGIKPGTSAVTLLAADGFHTIYDERSRTPESLVMSFVGSLRNVHHYKWASDSDVLILVSPSHCDIFEQAGWTREQLAAELHSRLQIPADEVRIDADNCALGLTDEQIAGREHVAKFRAGGIHVVRVGADAGLFSGVIPVWPNSGPTGTTPVALPVN